MKKVLFATTAMTALIGTAQIAAADLTISGSAEMGIAGGDRYAEDGVTTSDPRFFQDFTISVDGSGETDGGLSFGFHVEIEDSNTSFLPNGDFGLDALDDEDATAGTGGAGFDNESVFISGAFGTLTLGETDGAYDKRLQEVALAGGTLADDETEHAGYDGNSGLDGSYDNQILRYDYEFGEFGFSVSLEQMDLDDDFTPVDSDVWGAGFSYDTAFGGVDVGFGLGYQTSSDIGDIWGMSVDADFGNGFVAAINYSKFSADEDFLPGDGEHIGLGVAYTMDAWTFAANWGQYDWDDDVEAAGEEYDADGLGLLVNYDLGGGAVIQAGYGQGDTDEPGSDTVDSWSLGVSMSF